MYSLSDANTMSIFCNRPINIPHDCSWRAIQPRRHSFSLYIDRSTRQESKASCQIGNRVLQKRPYRSCVTCMAQPVGTPPQDPAPSVAAGKRTPAASSAVIVGGGIGGLILAVALRQIGVDAQVYEKAEARDVTSGTLISLAPNGLKALAAIDPRIPKRIFENGAPLKETKVRTREGVVMTATKSDVARNGYPVVCIRWSKILETFREFLPDTCQHSGYSFTGQIRQLEGGDVAVVFDKEGEEVVVESPLVVGFDGIHSLVRTHVIGREVPPRDMERMAWRAVVPRNFYEHEMNAPGVATMAFSGGRTFFLADPGMDSTYVCVTCTDEASGGATRHLSKDADEAKRRMVKQMGEWKEYLPILKRLDAESIVERRIQDLPPLPTWHRGRVVIMGDAAHAMPPAIGQGANTAIEDSLELARQIAQHHSIEQALEEFEKLQMPRVAGIVDKNNTMVAIAYRKPQAEEGEGGGGGQFSVNTPKSGTRPTSMADIPVNSIYDYERLTQPLVQ